MRRGQEHSLECFPMNNTLPVDLNSKKIKQIQKELISPGYTEPVG